MFFMLSGLIPIATFAGDFRSSGSVNINTPQHEDIYITAGRVTINAPVYGDVIIAGGTVIINDSVMGDVLVAGGKVMVNGYVGDDMRATGGHVILNSYVKGDIVAAGGVVEIERNATASSVTVTGGRVLFGGRSLNDLKVAAGEFSLTGIVGRNAEIKGGTIHIKGNITGKATLAASEDIRIYDGARIGRGIQYWLPFERTLEIPANVTEGKPVFNPLLSITHEKWYFLGASTFVGLMWYLGMAFLLILLIQYLFSGTFFRAGIRAHTNPVRSGLLGLGYFICVPICAVLLLVTVIGLPLTLIISVFYITTVLLATIISSVVIVNWISYLSDREYSLIKMSGMALLVFTLLKIITFTPFFGTPLAMVIVFVSFGAIMSSVHWKPIRTGQKHVQSSALSPQLEEVHP
jgi:hypothetical protein